jgi:YD repeat-containing protein
LNWDNSVYSTVKTTFNGRDQTTEVKQYQGADTSSTFQTTTATFDGHGRLKTGHRPEQLNANGTPASTTYNYNVDDRISSITDARGATTNYVYNDSRGLLTNINYSVPANSNISVTPSVSFIYDNAGNRISMNDGMGSVSYEYNQLSQLKAETRQFSDYLTDGSVPVNGFRMEYDYTIGGQLKSYKDPYNREFQFGLDKIGRNTAISSTTAYAGITNYTSDYQYRAFGSVKQVTYGNQTTATMTYNNRLQPNSYRLNDATQTLFGKDYYYTTPGYNDNDGLLKKSVHIDNTMSANEQAKRDQVNSYDALGRITKSETGEPGLTPFGNLKNGPFQQNLNYDAFGNLTAKNDRDFGTNQVGCSGCPRNISYNETIVNKRTQSSSFLVGNNYQNITNYQYDNDGRLINRDGDLATFDANGKMVFHDSLGTAPDDSYAYDGNGDLAKWVETGSSAPFYYYVKSSVFGANMLELNSSGAMFKENVFSSSGSKIAYLKENDVVWLHEEPSGKERYEIKQDRTASSKQTYDPTGVQPTNNGYSGGQPCPPMTCTSPENSAMWQQTNRGFDGLGRLQAQRYQQNWQDSVFWNLRSYINAGVVVGLNPPVGWTPYQDNLNRISHWRAYDQNNPNGSNIETFALWDESRYFNQVDIGSKGLKYLEFKDNESAGQFLENALKGGDCSSAIEKLINKLAEITKVKAATTNLLTLFNQIKDQSIGGLRLNNPPGSDLAELLNKETDQLYGKSTKLEPGILALGLSTRLINNSVSINGKRVEFHGEAIVYVGSTGFFPDNIGSRYAAQRTLQTLIHELVHVAASQGTYDHDDSNIVTADVLKELKATSVNDYINQHCKIR